MAFTLISKRNSSKKIVTKYGNNKTSHIAMDQMLFFVTSNSVMMSIKFLKLQHCNFTDNKSVCREEAIDTFL